jgi:hypothetical protein
MGNVIANVLQNLRDYNYVIPYVKAIEFCYLNSPIFKERPFFPKYFEPFKNMRERTYYYINDYHQYTLEMLEDDERKKALAIIYIFVVGITQREQDIILNNYAGGEDFQRLLKQEPVFEMNVFPYREFTDMGIRFNEVYGYTYPIAFEEAMSHYDLSLTDSTNIAVFGAEFSKG